MNVKDIKTLVGIMEDSSLTALEIEVPDLKLRLERSAGTGSVAEVLQPPVYSSIPWILWRFSRRIDAGWEDQQCLTTKS